MPPLFPKASSQNSVWGLGFRFRVCEFRCFARDLQSRRLLPYYRAFLNLQTPQPSPTIRKMILMFMLRIPVVKPIWVVFKIRVPFRVLFL